MSELASVAEAAAALGISARAVTKRIAAGHMAAERVGRDWVITRAEVERQRGLGALKRGPRRREGA